MFTMRIYFFSKLKEYYVIEELKKGIDEIQNRFNNYEQMKVKK